MGWILSLLAFLLHHHQQLLSYQFSLVLLSFLLSLGLMV